MVEDEVKHKLSYGVSKREIDLGNITAQDVLFAIRVIYQWMAVNRKVEAMSRSLAPAVAWNERNFIANLMQSTLGQKLGGTVTSMLDDNEVKEVVKKIKKKKREG